MPTVPDVKIEKFVPKGCMPQRYVFGLMGFLAVANAYAMRSVLSVAITEMVVVHHGKLGQHVLIPDPNACPIQNSSTKPHHYNPENEFDWDEKTQGYILSAFFWGYVLTHIPGGLLAERFGGKQTLGLGILSTSILTILTPFAARAGPRWLITTRFVEGLGEGTTFPALNVLLAQWVPPMERGKLGALVFAGNQIGTVVSSTLTGVMLQHWDGDWPFVFYLFGVLGVVWYVVFCFLCYNDPASHPYISTEEREYLSETIGCLKRRENLAPTPWKAMALSIPLWGLIIGQIGHDWALFTIQTDLPKYMKSVMHFTVAQNGFLSSLPFLVMWFTALFSGWLCDFLLARNIISVTICRKTFTTIASVGPALGSLAASYAGCDKVMVATLFAIGMAFMGFFYPSLKVNALDLSPNYAGTLMAIVNGIGAIAGIITPTLIGYLTPNSHMLEWRLVFWISAGVVLITNVLYCFMGAAKVQPWNDIESSTNEEAVKWKSSEEDGLPNDKHIELAPKKV
ncbi:putative inorganic phosphate cotransporter isoform X1 [Macrosteles quadrilineatus]|uniref:putative inorganic phosphate cotransporter isoform X1 n=1 Tax=Macrosteles quadrilineatus TaxID=74068 RepID=UPI0023E23D0E|nr:putative inorganic phosphate cotransporter isoform X1 [Macrosteles quadrilineatus]